jgi:lysophospholipase L1-like esterase
MSQSSRPRLTAFSIIAVILVLGLSETALRAAKFRYQAGPVYMRFGYPDEKIISRIFKRDPALFWKLIPGSLYLPDKIRVNSRGYRGREFNQEKPPGALRIISLGDSCTFLGEKSYPERLEEKLRKAYPGKTIEVINMAVPGYSSFQGLRQIEKNMDELKPDLITIFFGWNDQWPNKGVPDKDQKVPDSNLRKTLGSLRIYQGIHWIVNKLRPKPKPGPRVPLQDFNENIKRMNELAISKNSKLILITAPTGAKQGSELAPYLTAEGIIDNPDEALNLHERYNDEARQAAKEIRVLVVDAAELFKENPQKNFFWNDNIHLSEKGLDWLAEIIADMIISEKLI